MQGAMIRDTMVIPQSIQTKKKMDSMEQNDGANSIKDRNQVHVSV